MVGTVTIKRSKYVGTTLSVFILQRKEDFRKELVRYENRTMVAPTRIE